ncbi:MAG: aspartate--ammonia ligase [Lachnospirales bacterium]
MSKTYIPDGYKSSLTLYQTQKAIDILKHTFQVEFRRELNVVRATAPLFVLEDSGLNDDLNGVERPVSFDIPATNSNAQVVQSLAKWKRMALYDYEFLPGKGIYTDMNAIRRDDVIDNLHSVYVDQWDWEKVITRETRTNETLEATVRSIVNCIVHTLEQVKLHYPVIDVKLSHEVVFISTQELLDMYPDLTPKEREHAIAKKHKTVFLTQIGGKLSNGESHDGRAPDYDDWTLNGDLLFWNEVLEQSIEISSMGIRVDAKSLDSQLTISNNDDRRRFEYHKMILNDTYPLSIGGGIGQSRLCMLILGKAHIGEVQVSLWDEETKKVCKEAGVQIL